MSSSYRRPKGTYDVFPGGREPNERPDLWSWVEGVARDLFRRYNYSEIRTPVFEEEQVFVRGVGEGSDIVRKEMFSFEDKAGREMALRPEGTAGVVRAYVEHNLYKLAQPVKLWYKGPMFRHERQQKGRFRQHTQIGAEVLGASDPLVDVEVIALLYDLHQAVGVRDEVVYVNHLGDFATREAYIPELKSYLEKHREDLDPDSVSRLDTNPLRILDSKDKDTQTLLAEAPSLGDFLTEEAQGHFSAVKEGLGALGVPYEVDDRLVRGLDYVHLDGLRGEERSFGCAGRGWEWGTIQQPDLRPWRPGPRRHRVWERGGADAAGRPLPRRKSIGRRVLRHPRPRSPTTGTETGGPTSLRRNLLRPRLRRPKSKRPIQAGRPRGGFVHGGDRGRRVELRILHATRHDDRRGAKHILRWRPGGPGPRHPVENQARGSRCTLVLSDRKDEGRRPHIRSLVFDPDLIKCL